MCNVCFVGLCLYLDTSHVLLVVHRTLQCTLYTTLYIVHRALYSVYCAYQKCFVRALHKCALYIAHSTRVGIGRYITAR